MRFELLRLMLYFIQTVSPVTVQVQWVTLFNWGQMWHLVLVHKFNLFLMLVKNWVRSGVSDLFVQSVSEVLAVTGTLLCKNSRISGCLVVLSFPLLDISNRKCVFCLGLRAVSCHSWQSALTACLFRLGGLLYANIGFLSWRPVCPNFCSQVFF